MNRPADQHPISNVLSSPPMLSMPVEARYEHQLDPEEPGLRSYFNILYDSRWLIGLVTFLITAVAIVYAVVANPVYQANLLIHVEEESPNASKNILAEVSSLFETKKDAIAEMELLRSRMVISHAVDNLQLYIEVRPKYFPVIGFWFAGRGDGELSEPGIFGHGGYVWGAEKAVVSVFDVPEPWQNRRFLITAMGDGVYRLSGGGQPIVYEGRVGTTLKTQTSGGNLELRIDRLDAKPGAEFYLRRLSRLGTIEGIQTAMVISEQGKQSGIIEVRLQGDDPQRINNVLSEIGREYMRQNLARKTEEAEKSLAFLNLQLPALKRQLEQSEERYNHFRNSHGTVDMREEARMSLQQAAEARSRRIALQQKKTELLTRFTEDHPIVRGVNRQSREVEAEIDDVQKHIKSLPALEQDEARLVREIKVNTDLYTALSNTAQQLRLISVGRVSNVRMIDAPMAPERPIKPNRPLIVVLAAITGMFLGTMIAFVRRALNGGIDDPQKIERLLGARVVYASIPHSPNEEKLSRKARDDGANLPLLAQAEPEDIAVESLRGFRAALLFAMPHFRNNIVMITGPARNLGKSFVTVNLAAVMAASGKRVLLIDADLRNGHLHRYFGVSREFGLSNVIAGGTPVGDIIHRGVLENLDFIPTGALPPNRSEFLLHLNFGTLLESVSAQYDLVLLDPPPILAVADALIIGAHAGAVFILARAGRTTEEEINESIKRLNHAGISPQGVLFNDLSLRLSGYRYQFHYEQDAQIGYSR
ncbi:polysaccharide biosynthesis tyrosine autokinase [Massilia sp. GCM10020059]|uniref:Polysaccharide biosynthesis tyrosine autokinase n=1 Tax=Massilia agrisoli TaxID=2892444 RepID=A0ABS8IWB6_9BURK|nr:polysaccharide biosynthesis tyrosine autokinase [Massilia agrisoli]MCC6072168.1 polysaccharide biosynthesis tyrosine autokinase [Massilia agrisoli]